MTMEKSLPMIRRGSPETADRFMEGFQLVTGDSFVISLFI